MASLSGANAPTAARGQAGPPRRIVVWVRQDSGNLLRDPQGRRGAVDLCPSSGGRADEQRGRASHATRGDLAENQRRDRQCDREPIRRANADRRGDMSATGPQRPRLPEVVFRGESTQPTGSLPSARRTEKRQCRLIPATPPCERLPSAGIQRQPFEVWMLDSLGALGVKRLKLEHRERIAGVIDYCRAAFERQVPFDYGFRMEDDSLYCLELTEKAFRSQGLALSEPVRIGDWEYLASFPLTAMLIPPVTGMVLDRPITLEQPVHVPGNERNGVWASPLLETVIGPAPKVFQDACLGEPGRLNLKGDLDLLVFTFWEVRRSYAQLPARLLCDLILQMRARGPLQAGGRELKRASLG